MVMWAIFCIIGVPLFAIGVQVWSDQGADKLRYADKDTIHILEREHVSFKGAQEHIKHDIEEIKESQKIMQEDVREIKKILIDLNRQH